MAELLKRRDDCRLCGSNDLVKVISLGKTPPANAFIKNVETPELFFPLDLYFCRGCSLVQIIDVVSPDFLFKNYIYVSSTSKTFVKHFNDLVDSLSKRFEMPLKSLIVDIGSNDGILLRSFKKMGAKVIGIDPAVNIARKASTSGIPTIPKFFDLGVAEEIIQKTGAKAKIVTATSVFSHVDDIAGFTKAVDNLLDKDGVFVVEVYYLADLIKKNLFDTIYHEHLSYFTVNTLSKFFRKVGMELFDVEHTDTHGGSLRVFVQKSNGPHKINRGRIMDFISEEKEKDLDVVWRYLDFANSIEKNRSILMKLLRELKFEGYSIAGYGAAAKANTLLNCFDMGTEMLDFIADDSSWKQGLLTPGKHIPVVKPSLVKKLKPDYILILAWNYAEQIMKKLRHTGYRGKFIIPTPIPKVIA